MPETFLKLDYRDLENWHEMFQRMPKQMQRIMESEARPLGKSIVEVMRQELEPVKYTGALERSVSSEIDIRKAQVIMKIGPTADHAAFVRYGTRPHWAPIAPLKAWAAWKLGDANAAYAIQRSIAQHGTSRWAEHLYGSRANDYVSRTMNRTQTRSAMDRFLSRVLGRIVQEGLRK